MIAVLHILFGALFTVAAAVSLGHILLRRLKLNLYRAERWLLGFVVGAALLSMIVFAVAALHLAYKGVFLAIGIAAIAAAARGFRDFCPAGPPPLPRLWKALFAVVFTAFTILYFIHALAPEMSPDGMSYHLGLVDHYYRAHGLVRITTNLYASLSQGTGMLFLFAYTFGKHSAAALVHFAFLVTLVLLIVAWGRRFGFPGAGVAAALLVYASPVIGIDGSSAYNDLAAACLAFTVFYLLQLWDSDRAAGWLVPIGVAAGFCYAVKYTAVVAIPYALGFILWRARKLRPAIIVSACSALFIVPWMAKDWLWAANPIAPFFNSLFPNPYVHISFEQEYRSHMAHFGFLAGRWQIPADLTLHGVALGGLLGPVFLLAPLALLALRRRAGRQVLLAGAVFLIPYFANIGTRFTIPALSFIAVAMALALIDVPVALAAIVVIHAVLSWPAVVHRYSPAVWSLHGFPVRAALRLVPEDIWLSHNAGPYIFARMIQRNVPDGERVLSLGGGVAEAYTTHDILVSYQSAEGQVLADILYSGMVAPNTSTDVEEFRFAAHPLRKLRVVETAKGADVWSIGEFRVYHGETELPRDPAWRLRAHPNPWGVQLAFDNSLVTRWRSWQPIDQGMFVEVDFDRAEIADRVRLESPPDQRQVRLKLEGMDDSGRWTTLADAKKLDGAAPAGMRLAATEELKRRGIHYVATSPTDYDESDFRANADQWGFTLLQEQGGMRIYRLDGRK
ncbi:MAG: glycosyltransferase family 39 protein [Bryobacteraceae bacterium]